MPSSDPPETPAGPGQSDLIDALVRTSFVITAVLSKVAAEHDMSLTQVRVLGILRDHQGAMSELATYLGLDKSTISGLVDRAERRGLLRRTPNPSDGRGVFVALTADGVELAELGAAEVARALSPLTDTFTAPEARRLTSLLDRMLASGAAIP